jgi:hypothetical protein
VGKYFKNTSLYTEMIHNLKYKDAHRTTIHHRDFNRYNNAPDNLTYMDYKDHFLYHSEHTKKIWKTLKTFYPDLYKQRIKNLKNSIKRFIKDQTTEQKQIRAQNSRKSLIKAKAKQLELLKNPQYNQKYRKNHSTALTHFFNKMTPEEYQAHMAKSNKKRLANPNFWNLVKKQHDHQKLIYDDTILKFAIDQIKGKTTHEYTGVQLLKEINNGPILQHFIDINKNQAPPNFNFRFKKHNLKELAKSFGYKSWLHLRKEYKHFNHRLVKIEYLDQPIQVGTLTIDGQEQYHNYHTFALDCGVMTYNSLGDIPELFYFIKKLYKALKVPVTRLNVDDVFQDGTSMLREELKFARFVIRMQQRFAEGLKNGFITHLKLKKLWDKCELKEGMLDIIFNVPTNFYELRESQKFQLKADNFNMMSNNPLISITFAQKKYLGWSDTDLMANREFLRKDKALLYELAQLESRGPNWQNEEAPTGEPGTTVGAAAGLGGGSSGAANAGTPPDFGPGPAGGEAAGGEAEIPAAGGASPATTAPATGGAK